MNTWLTRLIFLTIGVTGIVLGGFSSMEDLGILHYKQDMLPDWFFLLGFIGCLSFILWFIMMSSKEDR